MKITRFSLQPAYVLHAQKYLNTSLLLRVFTQDYGIVSMIAKGARRPKSATSAHTQLFCPLKLSASGRSELKTMTDLEVAGKYTPLSGDGIFCGFYLNELLLKLIGPHDPHPKLFLRYQFTLEQLATSTNVSTSLRNFEAFLLSALGYGIDFKRDSAGHAIQANVNYHYIPEQGFVRASPHSSLALYSGATLEAIHHRHWQIEGSEQAAKRIFRIAISNLPGKYGKLHSRQLIQQHHQSKQTSTENTLCTHP